jgi:hypothetical protein
MAPTGHILVKKLLADTAVQLILVHCFNARLDLIVAGLQALNGPLTG